MSKNSDLGTNLRKKLVIWVFGVLKPALTQAIRNKLNLILAKPIW